MTYALDRSIPTQNVNTKCRVFAYSCKAIPTATLSPYTVFESILYVSPCPVAVVFLFEQYCHRLCDTTPRCFCCLAGLNTFATEIFQLAIDEAAWYKLTCYFLIRLTFRAPVHFSFLFRCVLMASVVGCLPIV